MSRQTVIIVVVLVAAAAVGFWFVRQQGIDQAYTEAVALCDSDPRRGAAELKALDRLYGDDSAPSSLAMEASICKLQAATDAYKRAATALSP